MNENVSVYRDRFVSCFNKRNSHLNIVRELCSSLRHDRQYSSLYDVTNSFSNGYMYLYARAFRLGFIDQGELDNLVFEVKDISRHLYHGQVDYFVYVPKFVTEVQDD